MATAKIETTGISVRKGKVQLRLCFYLNPTDVRYDEHHIQVPVFPNPDDLLGGYSGELRTEEFIATELEGGRLEPEIRTRMVPTSWEDFNNWVEGLPKKWQNNPFHNHFVRVSPDATDSEIGKLMQDLLEEFYGIWSRGEDILDIATKSLPELSSTNQLKVVNIGGSWFKAYDKVWKPKREVPGDLSLENIERCELKALDIANRVSVFEQGEA